MSSYATQADIVALYGEQALYVADRDGDGAADGAAVSRALESAAAEVDSRIGVRHALPLPAVPAFLRQVCVDIALYRLALARDVLSEEHRRRYEDALRWLGDVAAGRASLNLPSPADPESGGTPPAAPRPVVTSGPERLFSREQMRGL